MRNKSLAARTPSDVQKMSRAPRLFVRFKSATCPHCVTSQPGWDGMVKKLQGYKLAPGCMVGEIESSLAHEFQATNPDGTPFQVGPVPAYEFFRNGKREPFDPPGRDAAALLHVLQSQRFLQKKSRLSSRRRRQTRRV